MIEGVLTFLKEAWKALVIIGGFALILFIVTEIPRRIEQKRKGQSVEEDRAKKAH